MFGFGGMDWTGLVWNGGMEWNDYLRVTKFCGSGLVSRQTRCELDENAKLYPVSLNSIATICTIKY